MDTRQLDQILQTNPYTAKAFMGTFASDALPFPTTFPASFIVNMDNSQQRGSHWAGIYASSHSKVAYFDSYGLRPPELILNFLRNFKDIDHSAFVVQSIVSNICGYYAIYFVLSSRGKSLDDILYTLAAEYNSDQFVYDFVLKLIQ